MITADRPLRIFPSLVTMLNDGVRGHFHVTTLIVQSPSNFLHSPPVYAKIVVARPCGRPEMNALGGIIEQDLNIIHKTSKKMVTSS